jgi:hypothetical protein
MWKHFLVQWIVAGVCAGTRLWAAAFAESVEDYVPGTGFATEFGTGLGYTNASAALGQPNRETAFGAVTPFNPPFDRAELVSVALDGHLVVRMETPVQDLPDNPFGLDFIIYGSAGFVDVDYPNGLTDERASLFGQNLGLTRVSVSRDNVQFFALDPALAPLVDEFYPTDGSGAFGLPVDPALDPLTFANQTLAGIRAMYAGSAGGTAFDLAWARDENGQAVVLDDVRFIRVDVFSGRAEIDGFAVVPEPATGVLFGLILLTATICVFAQRPSSPRSSRTN